MNFLVNIPYISLLKIKNINIFLFIFTYKTNKNDIFNFLYSNFNFLSFFFNKKIIHNLICIKKYSATAQFYAFLSNIRRESSIFIFKSKLIIYLYIYILKYILPS